MTNRELIEALSKRNPDQEVVIQDADGELLSIDEVFVSSQDFDVSNKVHTLDRGIIYPSDVTVLK